jgi:hypothetical protein
LNGRGGLISNRDHRREQRSRQDRPRLNVNKERGVGVGRSDEERVLRSLANERRRRRRGCVLMKLAGQAGGGRQRTAARARSGRGGEGVPPRRRNFPGIRDATCRECDTVAWLIAASDAPTGNPLADCVSCRNFAALSQSVGRSVGVCVSSLLITDLISPAVNGCCTPVQFPVSARRRSRAILLVIGIRDYE